MKAGFASPLFKQLDDTGARVKGKNHFVHVLCNDLFTAYCTRLHKDRLTVLEILTLGDLTFRFDDTAYALMTQMNLPEKWIKPLKKRAFKETLDRDQLDTLLNETFQDPKKHIKAKRII